MARSQRLASRRLLGAAIALTLVGAMAGCNTPAAGDAEETVEVTETTPGGTLTTMALGPVQTWDPQRISSRSDAAFAGRVFARALTAYQHGPDAAAQVTLTGDLATDTGSADENLTVWTFTLREGVKWQDGSLLTCEDVKYGISRAFATDELTGGPNYAVAYLDVPKTPEGVSVYLGPYAEDPEDKKVAAGQKAFDKAVVCDGQDLTIRLSEPVADFAGMVSTPSFAAYKESVDKGAGSTFTVFSAGPYTLSGAWTPDRGGTFVRNPHWTAASDPIRMALPDQISYREGLEPQDAAQRIIADEEANTFAVALDTAPPAMQEQIAAAEPLSERSVNPLNGLVDYLAPNFSSAVMKHAQIRTAFALATDRSAYVDALGGPTTAAEATSILSRAVRSTMPDAGQSADPTGTPSPTETADPDPAETDPGEATETATADATGEPTDAASAKATDEATGEPTEDTEPTPTSDTATSDTATTDSATTDTATTGTEAEETPGAASSEVEQAKALLAGAARDAKLTLPVPVRVAYRSSPTMDSAMEALQAGWTQAGFDVELQPVAEEYFATISDAERAKETDVFWSNWAADWNSASTVLPPLFDSRINISKAGSGRNYGYFVDEKVDAAMSAAMSIADSRARDEAWFDIDTSLRSRGAYVALAERKSMHVAGSSVVNLVAHPALGGLVDLAVAGVDE